jgi:hypothetical protein
MRWHHGAGLFLVSGSLASLLVARGAGTVPLYDARVGRPCNTCHFDPNGGGPRNEFGLHYALQRHSLDAEAGKPWSDVELTNRVGDRFPLYVGVNQRFMLITSDAEFVDGVERVGFFSMENALHLTFRPYRLLTMVYTRDGFDQGSKSQDAFGLMTGGPWTSYLKAGRFRTPFGLRMDDHTVATRNGFLDFQAPPGTGFLPYDARSPDMGIEVGASRGAFFGRAAFTNGHSHPFGLGERRAQAKTLKLGFIGPGIQGAASLYDDFRDRTSPGQRRATRWGAYGMASKGPLAVLFEAGAGTDEFTGGGKNDVSAGFAELDYGPVRWLNLRARYDHLNLGVIGLATEDVIFHRYGLEADVVPMPFAELRATLRRIEPEEGAGEETQAYLQFHFSY